MTLTDREEQFRDLLTRDVEIPYGHFNYPCRLTLNPEAQYLSVQLHGNMPRGAGTTLPVFARWNWGKILGAHVLCICDPTLYLDDTLTIGWYLGTREENAIPGVVAIARRCAELVGIAPERIVFSGGSGGGFAALQAAALAKDGRAIVINAQTNLSEYFQADVEDYVKKASGCSSLDEAKQQYGSRWNAIESLREACSNGAAPKIVIVQNKNDWHHQKHYLPLAEVFGLDENAEQSVHGNFMSILYDGPHAHGSEPTEVVKRINKEGVSFLFNFSVDSFVPEIHIELRQEEDSIIVEISTNAADCLFACYFFKNNKILEDVSYSTNNRFVFNASGGAGDYKCKGFVLDASHTSFFVVSEIIHVS